MINITDEENRLVELLECSIEEARQVLADDKKIDKGEKLFEQTAEQKQYSKKYRQGDRKPTVYKFNQRQRKANPTKRELIEFLKTALDEYADLQNLEITNKERQIAFELQGEKFEITLVQKRKPKKK